jgi:hypothetical protein
MPRVLAVMESQLGTSSELENRAYLIHTDSSHCFPRRLKAADQSVCRKKRAIALFIIGEGIRVDSFQVLDRCIRGIGGWLLHCDRL